MKSRTDKLRDQHHRVLFWSIGVAVLLHVAVFGLSPTFRAEPIFSRDAVTEPGEGPPGTPLYVKASFGPPEILDENGEILRQDRELEADHVLELPPECLTRGRVDLPLHGRVRLRVMASGRTDVLDLAQATGSDCGDSVLTAVADALLYRWLPNERFPAPVDLIQPVSLLPTR